MSKQDKPDVTTSSAARSMPFRAVRRVSIPSLQLQINVPTCVRFLTAFKSQIDERRAVDDSKPLQVARVMVYSPDGGEVEEHSLVGGVVLVAMLQREYPDHGYVGLRFVITKEGKDPRLAYFTYDVVEVE